MESSTRLKKDLFEIWDKDILTISATDLDKEFYSFRYIYILYTSFWICGQVLHGSSLYIFSIFSLE